MIADGEARDPRPYSSDNAASLEPHLAGAVFNDTQGNKNVLAPSESEL